MCCVEEMRRNCVCCCFGVTVPKESCCNAGPFCLKWWSDDGNGCCGFSQNSWSLPSAISKWQIQDELQPGRRCLQERGRHARHVQTARRRTAGISINKDREKRGVRTQRQRWRCFPRRSVMASARCSPATLPVSLKRSSSGIFTQWISHQKR